ncbi:toll/interleukin-1 receptor domain-containing protein [Tissierella praeacuta]|uniref:toll/interleukin-1 receptor domain-containing protein n=1 Tax=Tissierella praeacuta TaxID=43131 RepID=UPI00333F8DF0
MSIEQYQRSVNSLDKDLETLEKKKADIDKKCSDLQSKITSAKKSITSRTSASMISSKMRQVNGWQSDYSKKSSESANLGRKISDKRQKRNDAYLKLQKAQQNEQKKQDKEMKRIKMSYEGRINELSRQAIPQMIVQAPPTLITSNDPEEYELFVSHAWEDKESFADEFVQELRDLGVKVWYDTSQIKWGDSMRVKIDDGLKKSKFGVVVLSPDYIREGKYWTKTELDGLFQLESVNGKTLLPVWHNLTKKDVMAYSPIIASKLAMTTASMTPQEIAKELVTLLPVSEQEEA